MRERGGIELVLNHTKMHPRHPLQREWALFTVHTQTYSLSLLQLTLYCIAY